VAQTVVNSPPIPKAVVSEGGALLVSWPIVGERIQRSSLGLVPAHASPMAAKLSSTELDEILAIQLTVAWAGEAAGDPKRLGWWKSDLVDREGGGDLFVRLIPKTAVWASLGLVRKAAIRVDETAREKLAHGDRVWTLFHFGFAVDEQLRDRLAWHRNHQNVPSECLGARYCVGSDWSKPAFESVLSGLGKSKVQVTPSGRQIETAAKSPVDVARLLGGALLPLTAEYPLPYAEVAA